MATVRELAQERHLESLAKLRQMKAHHQEVAKAEADAINAARMAQEAEREAKAAESG